MSKLDTYGFSDFSSFFEEAIEKAEAVEEKRTYSLVEILNDRFMNKHTKFSSLEEFIEKSGFDFSSEESLDAISSEALDAFVRQNSEFGSWEEMLGDALSELMRSKIFE